MQVSTYGRQAFSSSSDEGGIERWCQVAPQMIMLGTGRHQGRILAAGTPEEIRAHPSPEVQQFIRGEADGPVPLRMSQEDYVVKLLGHPRPLKKIIHT